MMQQENLPLTIEMLKSKLLAVYEYLMIGKDEENAGKVKQLAGKLVNQEFALAFCGHFSAGKSKMINRLLGEDLLPSSPIPTSANLVKVKGGEEYVKVFFKSEQPRLYLPPYDYKLIKDYCKDGDQIQEIEISHADFKLPEHTVIMDTPGIDSADDAHRIATESAIHLADLIFYVMDYNHVQSELNFMFTKELTAAGKEVYLVINQVDKHSSQEISFADFKTSVADSFAAWGVTPADIFYTSLKDDDHEHNEISQLESFVAERLQSKDSLLLQSIFQSLQKICKDHLEGRRKQGEQALEPCLAILGELPAAQQEELAENYDKLIAAQAALGQGLYAAEQEFEAEVNKIMSNAYLMPFETRALARSYLEACQPGFKMGWLFTKQKTAAAREERLELFYQGITEKTKSQLEWHLREFLLSFLKKQRLENQQLLAKMQGFQADCSKEILAAAVKEGARMSDDYVILYSGDVANEIKRLAKVSLTEMKREILQALEVQHRTLQEQLTQKTASLGRYVNALEEVKRSRAAKLDEQNQLLARLAMQNHGAEDQLQLFVQPEIAFEVVYGSGEPPATPVSTSPAQPVPPKAAAAPKTAAAPADLMKNMAKKLQTTAHLVQGLPGFAKLAAELAEKAERLQHKGFTVALFGAFSAGKSSFANALLGDRVLPVSPNPMTAAISKIRPVDGEHPHGTVLIRLKDTAAMLEDVNNALKLFELQGDSLADALGKAQSIDGQLEQLGAAEKTNYTFLRAFIRGFGEFSPHLGQVLQKTLAEFGDYVAVEEKSCFVDWIDLYYDCPLTAKGITLVDTPGADSINARHTGVAFDYIKNSDAILFVTYYNHAFSKADREFLIQLGRVKDSFQLDKMFFLINAIDLADNEEEKTAVMEYVTEQLLKYGVKQPHLYPVSSLLALEEKLDNSGKVHSGLPVFEQAFYHFISNDLANLAVAASANELERVGRLVDRLIASTQEDAAVKQQKRLAMEAEKAGIHQLLQQETVQSLNTNLQQQAQVLVYYIKQRVFLRFSDFFKESFNPSVLRDDGRNLKKVLRSALQELLEEVGFDLAQEMRATTVRLDRFAEKITAEYQSRLSEMIRETNVDLSFSQFELEADPNIDFNPAFMELPHSLFAKALDGFKNPKAFFEKQGSKVMRDELYTILSQEADCYLQLQLQRVQELYGKIMEEQFSRLIVQMDRQTDDFYLSVLSALDGGVPAEQLMAIKKGLAELG